MHIKVNLHCFSPVYGHLEILPTILNVFLHLLNKNINDFSAKIHVYHIFLNYTKSPFTYLKL